MFYIIVGCVTVWVIGVTLAWTGGGAIHLWLIAALTLFLMQLVRVRPSHT